MKKVELILLLSGMFCSVTVLIADDNDRADDQVTNQCENGFHSKNTPQQQFFNRLDDATYHDFIKEFMTELDKSSNLTPKIIRKIVHELGGDLAIKIGYHRLMPEFYKLASLLEPDKKLQFMKDYLKFRPLHKAAKENDTPKTRNLIELARLSNRSVDIEVNYPIIGGRTPLHMAVIFESNSTAKLLIENGSVNIEDDDGYTPFMRAVQTNSPSLIQIFIENNCDPRGVDLTNIKDKFLKQKLKAYIKQYQ